MRNGDFQIALANRNTPVYYIAFRRRDHHAQNAITGLQAATAHPLEIGHDSRRATGPEKAVGLLADIHRGSPAG